MALIYGTDVVKEVKLLGLKTSLDVSCVNQLANIITDIFQHFQHITITVDCSNLLQD